MQPNQAGQFIVEAQMEWWFEDDTSTLDGKTATVELNVVPLATPVPTTPPQQAAPFPSSGGGDGCFAAGGSGGAGSLMLLGLLILPVVGLMARPLLARPALPRAARAGLAPLDLLARTVLVWPVRSVRSAVHSPLRKAILMALVFEAVALSLLALLVHFLWGDEPTRSNLTVLVWPLTSVIALVTVSMLAKPNMPVALLGVPLMFWLGILMLLHFSNFVLGDPTLFYAADNWGSLIVLLVILGITGLFSLRRARAGRDTR